jgi:hypothetical protein
VVSDRFRGTGELEKDEDYLNDELRLWLPEE